MKRTANIAILLLSVSLILILPLVPHHHHKTVECVAMERCIVDDTYNDSHTAHRADSGSDDNSLCVKNIKSLQAKSEIHKDYNVIHLLPLFISTASEMLVDMQRQAEPLYDGYQISYRSPLVQGVLSLRAPPSLLS